MDNFTKEQIDRFISYFKDQLTAIERLPSDLHKNVLLSVILDTLAVARFPELPGRRNSSPRFKKLIRECTFWTDCEKISIPQLFYNLETSGKNTQLFKEVEKRFQRWGYGHIYGLENDIFRSEIEELATTKEELNSINYSSHFELLYLFRNRLLHEFRQPGVWD